MYSFGIRCYGLILWIAHFFHPKANSWIKGRQHFFENLPKVNDKKVYWFHCASLGEFDQGLPLLNGLKAEDPSLFIVVTFFSPSGFEHYHKRQHSADFVCYLPLDTPRNAQRFIQHFQPKSVFFVKYEFWKNYLYFAKKSGAKVYSVSALFRKNHRFFHPIFGRFFKGVLAQFDYFFVQNESSKVLLNSIGFQNVVLTGDTRFDRVIEHKNHLQDDAIIRQFLKGNKALILGSSWPEEEQLMHDWYAKQSEPLPLIIAPHDISEKHIEGLMRQWSDVKWVRYTQAENQDLANATVLIVDCIGKLANAYQYGKLAFVGGGFSGSLHNILEPAVFKLPILIGPKFNRFPEAIDFVAEKVAFSVTSLADVEAQMRYISEHEDEIKNRLDQLITSSSGATATIIAYLNQTKN